MDERIQGHDKEPRVHSHQESQRTGGHQRRWQNEKGCTAQGQTGCANRHNTEFHITSGKLACQQCSKPDAQRSHRKQQPATIPVQPQHFLAIQQNVLLKKGAQVREIGGTHDCGQQVAICGNILDGPKDLNNEQRIIPLRPSPGRRTVDTQTRKQPHHGQAHTDQPHLNKTVPKNLPQHKWRDKRTDDNGQVRTANQPAVSTRELLTRHQLRNNAVFGRAKNGALGAHQKDRAVKK